jgi:hypothetical protein
MSAPPVATWLFHQFRPRDTALAGDLLEQMADGRSRGWYWRQVLRAIVSRSAMDILRHPFLGLRALATGWIVLLLVFALSGDLAAEAIAKLFWGWTRGTGYNTAYWWPFYVSATFVSYTGFALSTLAVVRLHREKAMSMVLAYACSVVAVLVTSAAVFDWLNRPVPVPHTLFYVVSVSLPYTWRSGLILAPVVIVSSGLVATAVRRVKQHSLPEKLRDRIAP